MSEGDHSARRGRQVFALRIPPESLGPAWVSMHYERTPRFRRLKLRWLRHLVSLHCNRKTEGCGRVMKRECWAVPSGGGFAPAPPGFIALVPLAMRGLYPRREKGCRSIPPRSVEATESALRLLPSVWPWVWAKRARNSMTQWSGGD